MKKPILKKEMNKPDPFNIGLGYSYAASSSLQLTDLFSYYGRRERECEREREREGGDTYWDHMQAYGYLVLAPTSFDGGGRPKLIERLGRRRQCIACTTVNGGHHTHYDVLGLSPNASCSEIKRAYRFLALKVPIPYLYSYF